MIPDKYLYISPRQASQTLITHILEAMEKEPERSFTIALSGGTTPAVLFEVWEREFAAYTPWARLYFYWVDERCVPPTDAQSNFGLADRLLFGKINLPASHYYRIVGEGAPGEEAILYSSLVKATVSKKSSKSRTSVSPSSKAMVTCSDSKSRTSRITSSAEGKKNRGRFRSRDPFFSRRSLALSAFELYPPGNR